MSHQAQVRFSVSWALVKSALRRVDPQNAERLIVKLEQHFVELGLVQRAADLPLRMRRPPI